MKIKVKDLLPNPFRNIENYPISREKVEGLKNSINETDFWDNVVARKEKGGKYEIAYGHHRLVALQELKIKTVNIPVRNLDDARMLKMMADENLDIWQHNTAVINETVLAAKEFISSALAKCEKWEDLGPLNLKDLFDSEPAFRSVKGKTVGGKTILKFLGGNWKQSMIEPALAILNDKEISREAVETFSNPSHADAFREIVKGSGLTKQEQKVLAEEIDQTLGDEKTAKTVRGLTTKRLVKIKPETIESHKVGRFERKVKSVSSLIERLHKEMGDLRQLGGASMESVHAFLKEKDVTGSDITGSLERLHQLCDKIELKTGQMGEGEGRINRLDLLNVLKLLKPALADRAIVEAMVYYYFMEDKIMAYNDLIWTVVSFPIGFTGLVKAVSLDNVLAYSEMKMIDISLSDDGSTLQIRGDDINAELPILVDAELPINEEYCKFIKSKIPNDSGWLDLPLDLFRALEFAVEFASIDITFPEGQYVFVKGDKVLSTDDSVAVMYDLKDRVDCDFAISKHRIARIKDYLIKFGTYGLKSYKIETIGENEQVIHFKGDNITVSANLHRNTPIPSVYRSELPLRIDNDKIQKTGWLPTCPDLLGKIFEGERRDYKDGFELPMELIKTLDKFNRFLKEEFPLYFEFDRCVVLQFTEGQLVCSIKTIQGKSISKTFRVEHGMKDQDIVVRLMYLRMILNYTRQLIHFDYDKNFDLNLVEFGNDYIRCLILFKKDGEQAVPEPDEIGILAELGPENRFLKGRE